MTDRELLEMALDALECWQRNEDCNEPMSNILEALRARLAQPEQEPVAWADKVDIDRDGHDLWVSRQKPAKDGVPLYTAPPQREWVGLTDEEINILFKNSLKSIPTGVIWNISRTIEAKLKEKNT